MASKNQSTLTVNEQKIKTNCFCRAMGKTTVCVTGLLEPSGGHRAVSRENQATAPFLWSVRNANQKQPRGRKGDLPKDVCDSLTYNHKMLEPAPRWLTGGTDRLTPGKAPEGFNQKGGLFLLGNCAHSVT